MGKVLSLRLQ